MAVDHGNRECLATLTRLSIWGIIPISVVFETYWTAHFFSDILVSGPSLLRDLANNYIEAAQPYIVPTSVKPSFAVRLSPITFRCPPGLNLFSLLSPVSRLPIVLIISIFQVHGICRGGPGRDSPDVPFHAGHTRRRHRCRFQPRCVDQQRDAYCRHRLRVVLGLSTAIQPLDAADQRLVTRRGRREAIPPFLAGDSTKRGVLLTALSASSRSRLTTS